MIKVLTELCSQKKMVSVYTDYNSVNKFYFGFIVAVNENEVAIHMISPDGEDDGIFVMNVNKIFRIETDGQYAKKMAKLCLNNPIFPNYFTVSDDDIMNSAISYAYDKRYVISIELNDSGFYDVVVIVVSIDDKKCKIKQIDEYGYEDGYSYVDITYVTTATVMSQDERRIKRLWELKTP